LLQRSSRPQRLGMSALSWAPSAFDLSAQPARDQRKGLYSHDMVSDRRDPSGPAELRPPANHYKYPADHDIVYVTAQTPVPKASLPDLPPPLPAQPPPQLPQVHTFEGRPTAFGSSQYVRRGQRCGDIGWGCFTVNTKESSQNGLRDGHAHVGADLNKKHQFMVLPGDPCFDKRIGKLVQAQTASGRPAKR